MENILAVVNLYVLLMLHHVQKTSIQFFQIYTKNHKIIKNSANKIEMTEKLQVLRNFSKKVLKYLGNILANVNLYV